MNYSRRIIRNSGTPILKHRINKWRLTGKSKRTESDREIMTAQEKTYFLDAGFTSEQIEEISKGKEARLNVSLYTNKIFLPIQMRQIRLGLLENLPAEIYAKPEYDWFQMEEIREGLKAKVDVSIYASSEIPYEKMRQIRKGLQENIDLSSYMKLEASILRQLRKARKSGVTILKYINLGYDAQQLAEIRIALEHGVEVEDYISNEYRAASIAEIRLGLEQGLDVSLYAMICYSWQQMREIRKGLENRLDVEKYCKPLYSWQQMKEIRHGLELGLDVDSYRLLRYTADEMRKRRMALLVDICNKQAKILQNQVRTDDFVFEYASNDMEAYITVLAKGKYITRERLLEILEKNNIRKGILEETVKKIVDGRYGNKPLPIAKGQIPHKGEDGWYEFFFRTDINRRPKVLEDGSVDYRNVEWFEMVKAEQKLAVYHEAKEGIDGYTVTGNVIKARKGAEQKILVGQGFRLEPDKKTYIATVDGMVSVEGNEMKITNHLLLDEVTMATGNIQFDGSVHILGDVGYGAFIKATGDIMIDGSVEAATIESGGNVVLKKGMNSAGKGLISAGKDIMSTFFEAVKVVAKGNIEVAKCLNSQLYADGTITSTRVIAGGVAQSENGFRMKHVGNQAGLHTVLKLKVSDAVWEENRIIKVAIQDVRSELQMLNRSYEEYKEKFPPEVRSNMEIFSKIEKAVYSKNKQLEQLLTVDEEVELRIKKAREAKIFITGQAYEGTILEMEGCRWFAENQRNIVVKKKEDQLEVLSG